MTKPQTKKVETAQANPTFTAWPSISFGTPSTEDGIYFTFLGVSGRVNAAADWNSPEHTKLWLYNLHYLNDLAFKDTKLAATQERLLDHWIAYNPASALGNGWEPYTLSLRLVNIVKWISRQEPPNQKHLDSLAAQASSLTRRLEYHILGNHLFANGKALVFSGSYLRGDEANKILAKGLNILDREIPEQFLADGAHFELSPMYHLALLWDLCDLIQLSQIVEIHEISKRANGWLEVLSRGIAWLESILHPDTEIPFFNDASFGIAPTWKELVGYAQKIGYKPPNISDLSGQLAYMPNTESGLASITWNPNTKAVIDLGQVGPKYQPGHAHADSLSFELSVHSQRLFVNSGTSEYGDGPERLRQRSTSAHNTVEIDGENSSEVWGGFRVARRANVQIVECRREPHLIHISASHDGYTRLSKGLTHTRSWTATQNRLEIADTISNRGKYAAVSRLHLHPNVDVQLLGSKVVATLPSGDLVSITFADAKNIQILNSSWHPRFGESTPNKCIQVTFSGDKITTSVTW